MSFRQFLCLTFIAACLNHHKFSTFQHSHSSISVPGPITATSEFAHLNTIPLSSFVSSRLRTNYSNYTFFPLLLILCGDIELNPGPTSSTFNVCTLNILSLTNRVHYTALSCLAEDHHVDLFALTETWITPSTTSAELFDSAPPGFSLLSSPRPLSSTKNKIVRGGTGLLVRDSLQIPSTQSPYFKSFEISAVTLKLPKSKLTVFSIYRPPPSSFRAVPFSQFLVDFQAVICHATTSPHHFLITRDFNLHLDDPQNSQA